MKLRVALLYGLLAVSLSGAWAAAGVAFPAQDRAGAPLPSDPEKLLQYARERLNHGDWIQADKAFKAWLEKQPDAPQAPDVHEHLAQLHLWRSRKAAEARTWLEKACAKWPKHGHYWNWRFQLAQTWAQQNLRDKAVEEYRKIGKEAPTPELRGNALRQAWSVQGKYFQLYVNQTFSAGQEPSVLAQLNQIDKVAYRALHVRWDALLDGLGGKDRRDLHETLEKLGPDARRVVKEWSAEYPIDKRNSWRQETLKIPATEPGVYVLEGTHEDVTMSVTVFVSRYGLVTKAAAGKILAFVQDRSTSRPAAGAEIRVLQGNDTLRGQTDAHGVFVSDGFKGGTVIAIKDGDVATTESYWNGMPDSRQLLHVSTDRPIYRPNQTVFFRVVKRHERGEKLSIQEGEKQVVEIRDAKGNKVYEKTHVFNAFGSAEGELTLGDEPPLGEYKIFLRAPEADPNTYQHSWQWYGMWHQGPRDFGKFRVDEYRKPEYKVDVEFQKSPVLQGEAVEASIVAAYYFGSPVVDAEVRWTVTRRPHYPSWRFGGCFYHAWYDDEGDDDDNEAFEGRGRRRFFRARQHEEQILQGSGRTDKEGKIKVLFDAPKTDYDAVYTVVAHVTDLSRRTVDGAGSLKATRAEFGLAMTLDKYVYKPGDTIHAKVRAATPDERPVPNTRIRVKGYDHRWRDGKNENELLFEGESTTDAQGIAGFDLAAKREGGYLRIVAEAVDTRGNTVSTEHYAWLAGENWAGDTVNLNGVDLTLDKESYAPGDTARILVTSQYRGLNLLFTVEGKEIFHHEVVAMKGHTKVVELKLDREAYAPNVFLGVIAIKENVVVQKRKKIVVDPSSRFVKVEIAPDQAQYRPRNKAVYSISTTGADGRPVSAEVSLGVVDASIYALQEEYAWDIRKHFVYRRGNEVGTTTSLRYWGYGRAEAKREKAAMDAAPAAPAAAAPMESRALGRKEAEGGGGAALAATEIRSKFADTMIWKTVRTGPDGKATVEVEIPDNLTTWKATARVATSDSRFGQETNEVVTRKDMIVRLEAPRFFTQNDEVVFSAIAHNYMAEAKDVHIEMSVEGLDVQGELKKIVKVASQGQERIDWKAKVRTAGQAVLTVKALAAGDSDAMKLTVPVLPHGATRWESKGGVAEGRIVEKVTIPDGPAREAAELVVVLSPTHASMVLDALDYLAGYPYGCVEQTMSRFLPTVIVSQALQKLGIEKKELQEELPRMVSTGLQRLYNFQQQDGGWGWWQNDKSNPWTTAYVVMGLAMAKNADHAVEPHVLTRGMHALQAHLAAAKDVDLRAYCLYALSAAGLRDDAARDGLARQLGELKPYGKALLAMTLAKDGKNAKEVLDVLAKEATAVGGAAYFEGDAGRGGWMDHSAEVTAACLRAFLAVDPKHPLVPRMTYWLSTTRQGNYWASTKQTALVVFALVEYLAATGDMNPDMELSLSLNGRNILRERVTKANWHAFQGMRTFKGAQLRPGENEIVIERQGNGTPIWSIYAKTYAEGEDLPASKGGIQVERTYGLVLRENGQRIVRKLESGATVTSGDEIEVTLSVSADRDYEWLMLDCPMPSGFEAVREYWGSPGWAPWNYWYARKEFRDEKVSIAMTTLGRGRHAVQYTMRAEAPGDVHILPAGVFNMYHPQIGGNSSEFRLKVVDRK